MISRLDRYGPTVRCAGAATPGTGVPHASVRSPRAFTIIEVLLAVAIFTMIMAAVYSTWTAILRSARVGNDAAVEVQRSRVASRTLQDALVSAVMFEANIGLYAFEVDTSGEFAAMSFTARLPASFIGSGYFGDQRMRRVTFNVEPGNDGVSQFMLRQVPLMQTNFIPEQIHTLVLAREIASFKLEFWDPREGWVAEWERTNRLPIQLRFQLAFGEPVERNQPGKEVTVRTIHLPSTHVPQQIQLPRTASPPGAPVTPTNPAPNAGG